MSDEKMSENECMKKSVDERANKYVKDYHVSGTSDYADNVMSYKAGYAQGKKDEADSNSTKLKEVLEYVKPHLKYMWAASIAGIILDCDFRDTPQEIQKLKVDGEK